MKFQETQEDVPEKVVQVPENFEMYDDDCVPRNGEPGKCDALINEQGVAFASNGIVEFTLGNLTEERIFELSHYDGKYSPIFTITGSLTCTEYKTKVSFVDFGNILFERNGQKVAISGGMVLP